MFPDYRKDQATSVSVSMPSAKVQYPSTMTSMPLRSKRNRNFYRLFKEHSNYVHLGHIRNGSLVRDERENRYSQHFDRLEHCILHNIDLHNCVVQDSTLENCNLVSYCMDACSINSSSIDTCQVQDSVFFDCKFRPGGLVRKTRKHRYTFNDVHSLLRNCKLFGCSVQRSLISRGSRWLAVRFTLRMSWTRMSKVSKSKTPPSNPASSWETLYNNQSCTAAISKTSTWNLQDWATRLLPLLWHSRNFLLSYET